MRAALTLLVSTALLWATPAGAGSRQVRVLVPSRDNLQFVTFWVTRQAGCFARQQIETELVIPAVNREIIPAMLNAEELVAVMPPPSLLEALAAGADVVAVANLLRNESVRHCGAARRWLQSFAGPGQGMGQPTRDAYFSAGFNPDYS